MRVNEVRGYSLFNEVQDDTLKATNRATVLANLLEDNIDRRGKLTEGGRDYALEYQGLIPEEDRWNVYEILEGILKERGIIDAD